MTVNTLTIRPLTKKQKEIADFISEYYHKRGYSPSLEEIAKEFHLKAVSTVHKHISFIKKKGYLQKQAFQSRGVKPLNISDNTIQVPLLGIIAAGNPIEPIENPEPIEVPASMLNRNYNYYALKVKGDSMIEDDVWDGDIILIKHQKDADTGDMVVAVVNGDVTLKRYGGIEKGKVKLIPRNPRLKPFLVETNNFEVRGKFAGLLRRS
jgi:repressor LexA